MHLGENYFKFSSNIYYYYSIYKRYFVQEEDLNYHNKWEACLRICIQELFLLIIMEKIE